MKLRKEQAHSDRLEVLRDLATYELNASKHSYRDASDWFTQTGQRIKVRSKEIEDVLGKLPMRIYFNRAESEDPIFKEQDRVHEHDEDNDSHTLWPGERHRVQNFSCTGSVYEILKNYEEQGKAIGTAAI